MHNRFAVILIVAGLLMGPGYYAYSAFFSGTEVAEERLGAKGERFTLSDGSVLRFPKANAFEPVVLDLAPEMNAVGLVLKLDITGDVRQEPVRGNEYRVLLLADGNPLVQKKVSIQRGTNLGPGEVWHELVALVDVPVSGKYYFVLEESAPPELPVTAITVEVRRNVVQANRGIVWSGVAMLALGVLSMLTGFGGGRGVVTRPR